MVNSPSLPLSHPIFQDTHLAMTSNRSHAADPLATNEILEEKHRHLHNDKEQNCNPPYVIDLHNHLHHTV